MEFREWVLGLGRGKKQGWLGDFWLMCTLDDIPLGRILAPFRVWGHWESDKLNDPPKLVYPVRDTAKLVFRFQDGCPFSYTMPLPAFRLLRALWSWEMKCLGCLSVSASGGRWFQEWFLLGPLQYLFCYQTKRLPPGVCSTEVSMADLSVFGKGTAELVWAFLYSGFGGWWQTQKCEEREKIYSLRWTIEWY